MQQTTSSFKGVCFYLKCPLSPPTPRAVGYLKCRPTTRVLVSTTANAVSLKGYMFFLKCRQRRPATKVGCLPQMQPMPSHHKGVSLNCQRCPSPRVYVFSRMPQSTSLYKGVILNAANAVPPQGYVFHIMTPKPSC